MLLKISSVILPDNIHQRAKALSSSFSGDDILFSRLDALSGFMAMAFSTSFSSLSDTESAFIRNTADEPGAVHFRGIAWKVGTDRGFKYDAKTAHCIFCMDGLCPSDGGKDRDRLYGDLKKSFL